MKKNEGVIITRKHNSTPEWETLDVDNGKWFLVQTNSDRHESCVRRDTAEKRLNNLSRNMTYDTLLNNVMALSPNKNADTIYTSIQSSRNNQAFVSSLYWLEPVEKGFLRP